MPAPAKPAGFPWRQGLSGSVKDRERTRVLEAEQVAPKVERRVRKVRKRRPEGQDARLRKPASGGSGGSR